MGFFAYQALARGIWQPLATCDTWSSCCSIAIAHVLTYASTPARTAASLDACAFSMRLATVFLRGLGRPLARTPHRLKVDSTASSDHGVYRVTQGISIIRGRPTHFAKLRQHRTRPICITPGVPRCARFRGFFLQLPSRVIHRGCCISHVADIFHVAPRRSAEIRTRDMQRPRYAKRKRSVFSTRVLCETEPR